MYSRLFLIFALVAKLTVLADLTIANCSGDVILGALFPVHLSDDVKTCGEIQNEDGVQLLEAMLFTLDEINRSGLLPFRLGAIGLDSCENDAYALRQVSRIIRISTYNAENSTIFQCRDGSAPNLRPYLEAFTDAKGWVGGASSEVTMQVATFLQLFQIPTISYQSTSPDLSNRERYTHFLRTVPSDVYQAKAMVAVLKDLNWKYVSVVYEETNYGIKGVSALEAEIVDTDICFTAKEKISISEHRTELPTRKGLAAPPNQYVKIVRRLLQKEHAKVVIVYARDIFAYQIFLVADKLNMHDRFIWLGSDGWSHRNAVVQGVEKVVRGAITVRPMSIPLPGFAEYFTSLKPFSNSRNPWFKEFWENHFDCSIKATSGSRSTCTGREDLNHTGGFELSVYSSMVRDAVYAFAYALKKVHRDKCGAHATSVCPNMKAVDGNELLTYLRVINFTDAAGDQFQFINGVDGIPRYSLVTFDLNSRGEYDWMEIGKYIGHNVSAALIFDSEFLKTKDRIPASQCAEQCGPTQATRYTEMDQCCWICQNCSENEYVASTKSDSHNDEQSCQKCDDGFWPNVNGTDCQPLPLMHTRYDTIWSIIAFSVASVGLIIVVIVSIIFIIYRNTPIIRATGKESSCVLMFGICLSYLSSLAFLQKPTEALCIAIRFLLGTCYTVCYAALLAKTIRIVRIFDSYNSGIKNVKYITTRYQLIFIASLVLVEEIIIASWSLAILDKPFILKVYPTVKSNILICYDAQGLPYLLVLVYPLILVISCTVYAFRARKTPDGFNESRNLGFCAYTTCIIWGAFIPVYYATWDHNYNAFIMSITVSLNATVELMCIFVSKVYIVILRPERNTRAAVMARSSSHLNSISVSVVPGNRTSTDESLSRRSLSDPSATNILSLVTSDTSLSTGESILLTPSTCNKNKAHSMSSSNSHTNQEIALKRNKTEPTINRHVNYDCRPHKRSGRTSMTSSGHSTDLDSVPNTDL
ncbi:metabotropic glutamate receptor 3-like isoform X2 [Tubulanus polymorphus]|uniref:metabotropic glutamate receptor 3-like isoform X2 n=1 Tax=Tubulanus polymorphus TaxID=672921 RepID=UPI003DA3F883